MSDYNRPDNIPAMPTPPDPTEPRDSFVEKAINVWNWLKGSVSYFNNIVTWINDTVLPKVEIADTIGDMSKYLGEWQDGMSVNKGESVSIGDTIYTSKIDNNTDTPPSDSWIIQGNGEVEAIPNTIVKRDSNGTIKFGKDGNQGELNNNAILLVSQKGTDEQVTFRINKYDTGNALDMRFYDKDGNIIGDILKVSDGIWRIPATPIIDWQDVTLASGYGAGYVRVRKLANGFVEVIVRAKQTNGESSYHWVQVCTIPSGFRPHTTVEQVDITSRAGYGGRIYIDTNGVMKAEAVGDYYHYAHFVYFVGL